ncbi:putative CMP-sialic acid transporter 4 [Cocos nucifera]|nr:putative CMP-sialic acid transporter 4 [Cocos nucifera]
MGASSAVRASAQKLENADELIDSVETFIFDCDGVIWKGDSLIDGVPETLDMLRSKGKRLVFVTNNSTKSRKQYGKKFETLGLSVNEEEIFASSFAAAAYLKSIDFPKDKKVYVIGEDGIIKELELAGFQYLGGPQECDIEFIHFQADGGGSMVGALCGSTQREPIVVGKPSTFMMDYLSNKFSAEMKNGMIECSVCHSKLLSPSPRTVSRAYDRHRSKISSRARALNVLLVVGDCIFVGLQPILVYMSKVDGKFMFSPVSVNFLTEIAKVLFAIVMLCLQAARNNVLLAVPALLYAINNYLKFIMQLYFNPATVKMLSNLKVTVPSLASVFNEYALKSQFETSIYLQNLFLYGYGAIFNFLFIIGTAIFKGPGSFDIFQGHSKATIFLICNNAAQGILSSFFFKYADTILKKYSSTVATIFTGIASAALFGHTLTMNFILGISIVFISMHQFFSPLAKVKDESPNGVLEMMDAQNLRPVTTLDLMRENHFCPNSGTF